MPMRPISSFDFILKVTVPSFFRFSFYPTALKGYLSIVFTHGVMKGCLIRQSGSRKKFVRAVFQKP